MLPIDTISGRLTIIKLVFNDEHHSSVYEKIKTKFFPPNLIIIVQASNMQEFINRTRP